MPLVAALLLLTAALPASADELTLIEALPTLAPFVRNANKPDVVLDKARAYLEVPWIFSGRSTKGIDCVGLVFTALSQTYGVRRRDYDRHNSRNAEVIARIGTVAALLTPEALDSDANVIAPGDVLALLWPTKNPVEPPLARLGEDPLWVWHVGLAVDAKTLLHAGPWAGKTIEEPLAAFVRKNQFAGVVVVRPARKKAPHPGSLRAPRLPGQDAGEGRPPPRRFAPPLPRQDAASPL